MVELVVLMRSCRSRMMKRRNVAEATAKAVRSNVADNDRVGQNVDDIAFGDGLGIGVGIGVGL